MSEVVDRENIRRRLTDMSAFWQDRIDSWRSGGTTSGTEKRHAQQFWSELLKCFAITPERIDVFERNANRASTGGSGYIDFFWSGVVIGEAKSLGHDLDAAYEQALDYLNGGSVSSHEWPLFILTTDFQNFRLDRLGEESWTLRFELSQLADHMEQLLFFAGVETLTKRERENASIEAAKIMADLFNTLVGEDVDELVGDDAPTTRDDEDDETERASILMTRLLFLLYGDDAGLWEEDLFYRWVESVNAKNLGPSLDGLFNILNTEIRHRGYLPDLESRFPYVNGGIFDGTGQVGYSVPPEFKEALLNAARFRWTQISPAIFGSMFQLVKSKEARRGDGEHYTSEANILKTIEPLFLEGYRDQADRLIRNKTTTRKEFLAFVDELASNIYLDPACGAGNFLNIAYAKLREIETDILIEMRRRTGSIDASLDVTFDQRLTIDRFYGFEINWWPAKIAETAMFLVDHQANRHMAQALGQAPDRLPIEITAIIIHNNALDLDWEQVLPKVSGKTFIFGNPPFIGQYNKTTVQTEDMVQVWGNDYDGYLDYVTGWHAKAKNLLADRYGEFAFVTTNSITQGQPVPALFGPLYRESWKIKFAHRTFAWDSEAPGQAAVHCVIVGFTKNRQIRQRLWDYPHVKGSPIEQKLQIGINAYLVDGPNVLVKKSTKPLSKRLPRLTRGIQATDGGHLVFKAGEGTRGVEKDPVAAKYLRPFIGGYELINSVDRWCFWFADLTSADRRASKKIQEAVEGCYQWRSEQKPTGDAYKLKDTPHLFRPSPYMPEESYLCIPRTFTENRSYMTAKRFGPEVIANDSTFIAPDKDGLLFALISSSMFMTWQRTVGGRLKSDPRFASTLTWNTFPVPALDDVARQNIIHAGKQVVVARDEYPDYSLDELYDPYLMGAKKTLQKAHNDLDREVDRAFGSTRRLTTDKQRLELLFPAYELLIRS